VRIKVIFNPHAGRGKAVKLKPEILAGLAESNYHWEETRRHGHAVEIAQKAVADRFDLIIAAGGDGTINQVVNGMVGSGIPLGVLGCGTGNDFASMLGMPKEPGRAVRRIIAGETRRVDLCRINNRYFISSVGIGFDGEVAYNVNRGIRFAGGMAAYLLGVFKTFFSFKLRRIKLVIDGKTREFNALMLAVTNSRSYGGGIKITPEARIDDGLFDICVVKDLPPVKILYCLPMAVKGIHHRLRNVEMFRGREVYLESSSPVFYHMDGEVFKDTVFHFSLLPGSFPVKGADFEPWLTAETAAAKEA